MDFNYTKIRLGNWLFRNAYPLYKFSYFRFKRKNDAEEIVLLKNLVRSGMVVYDIGANIGFYALILSRLVGEKGRLFCFEPDMENFRRLENNTRGLRNTTIVRKAVSDKDGTINIYKSKLLNVDHRTYPVNNYETVEEIGAVSLDTMLKRDKIPPPDVIKIDIQGYEMAAFKGMENTLRSLPHLKIVAEYWPHGFQRAGSSALAFFDYFTDLGYRFQIIEKNGLTELKRFYVEENNAQDFEYSFNVLISKN